MKTPQESSFSTTKPRDRRNILIFVLIASLLVLGYFQFFANKSADKKQQIATAQAFVRKHSVFNQKPHQSRLVVQSDLTNNSVLATNKVKKGDILMVYRSSGKAIVYRPSTKKIVTIIDVAVGGNQGLLSARRRFIIFHTTAKKAEAEQRKSELHKAFNIAKADIVLQQSSLDDVAASLIASNVADGSMSRDLIAVTEIITYPITLNKTPDSLKQPATGYDFILAIK